MDDVPALGSQACHDKMVNMEGCQLFTFSLSLLNNHPYILKAALFTGKLRNTEVTAIETATQTLTQGGSSSPRSILTCY